jgi:hypothetical protein
LLNAMSTSVLESHSSSPSSKYKEALNLFCFVMTAQGSKISIH